jgi:hypothetical protein
MDILTSHRTLNLENGNRTFTAGPPVSGTPLAVADFGLQRRPFHVPGSFQVGASGAKW